MTIEFTPGAKAFLASDSSTSSYSGVFEDDGRTGYFYAYDRAAPQHARILDACHIYNVADLRDADHASTAEIIWTGDGMRAALIINGRGHAVVDFAARRAYCRTNFPPPGGAWRAKTRVPWSDDVLADFGRSV